MIAAAITELKDRKGSSRQAILKYVEDKYKVGDVAKRFVGQALKRGVEKGDLSSPSAGRYRLVKKAAPKKKVSKKKAAAPTKKKTATKKKASTKKRAAPKKKASAKKASAKKAS